MGKVALKSGNHLIRAAQKSGHIAKINTEKIMKGRRRLGGLSLCPRLDISSGS